VYSQASAQPIEARAQATDQTTRKVDMKIACALASSIGVPIDIAAYRHHGLVAHATFRDHGQDAHAA
jgi:hypothetical protein